ncbi:hypothetical protein BS78_02G088500 [Paspalum vaginatum]|nr:hypothetical protein BS78_02G088500 [Paspalum vaginatum]
MATTHPCALAAFLLLALVSASSVAAVPMSKQRHGQQASVYMVMVKPPAQGVDCDAYHMRILAAAVGSMSRAKEALIYSYKLAASGFAAKLTPAQVAALQRNPAVLQALPDVKYSLQGSNHVNLQDSNHLN